VDESGICASAFTLASQWLVSFIYSSIKTQVTQRLSSSEASKDDASTSLVALVIPPFACHRTMCHATHAMPRHVPEMQGLFRAPAQFVAITFFLIVDDPTTPLCTTSTSNMEEEKKIDDADALVAAVTPRKAPLESPPMSFKAGGGKKGPSTNGAFKKKKMASLDDGRQSAVVMSSSSNNSCNGSRTNIATSPYQRSVIRSGLDGKRSAFEVKNWITCLLTLDGRDKFTKVSQMANEYTLF